MDCFNKVDALNVEGLYTDDAVNRQVANGSVAGNPSRKSVGRTTPFFTHKIKQNGEFLSIW